MAFTLSSDFSLVNDAGAVVARLTHEDAKAAYDVLRQTFGRPKKRTAMTDEERAVDLYQRYRKRYPNESANQLVKRIVSVYSCPRPSALLVRGWLREYGFEIPDAWTREECATMARAAKTRRYPPFGYEVADAEKWEASQVLLSDEDIKDLAEGGLARCGLRVAA